MNSNTSPVVGRVVFNTTPLNPPRFIEDRVRLERSHKQQLDELRNTIKSFIEEWEGLRVGDPMFEALRNLVK